MLAAIEKLPLGRKVLKDFSFMMLYAYEALKHQILFKVQEKNKVAV